MRIKVKFFASLREQLGQAEAQLEIDAVSTVADVWQQLVSQHELTTNILTAVNMQYVSHDHPLNDGDEVAFFPPVTGG